MQSSPTETLLKCPRIKLSNGVLHPQIGFGTYKVGYIPPSASSSASGKVIRSAYEVILDAIDTGYRSFDCAEFYNNETQVGEALAKSNIPREELFLCSKVWNSTIEQGSEAVKKRFHQSLKDLQTDYLDLYLIHWPVPNRHVQAYLALQELYKEGKVRAIGISNYTVEDYLELKQSPEYSIPAVVNQIEINPFLYRKNTINFFMNEGLMLQSYRGLGNNKVFQHPIIKKLAQSYNKTAAQILGRWCVQHGFIHFPKSEQKDRMQENAQIFDFVLEKKDMDELDSLTANDALQDFKILYEKCVNRDTSKDGKLEGVKTVITLD